MLCSPQELVRSISQTEGYILNEMGEGQENVQLSPASHVSASEMVCGPPGPHLSVTHTAFGAYPVARAPPL